MPAAPPSAAALLPPPPAVLLAPAPAPLPTVQPELPGPAAPAGVAPAGSSAGLTAALQQLQTLAQRVCGSSGTTSSAAKASQTIDLPLGSAFRGSYIHMYSDVPGQVRRLAVWLCRGEALFDTTCWPWALRAVHGHAASGV